jgi:hypothetical protein
LLAASVGVEVEPQAASELARAIAVSEKKVRRFMRLSSIELQNWDLRRPELLLVPRQRRRAG